MAEIIILIISIIAISPLILGVAFLLIVRASHTMDLIDARLSSAGVTQYLTDCAVAESITNEHNRSIFVKACEIEQEINFLLNSKTAH